MNLLPSRTDELPEVMRRSQVLADLELIAAEAERQNTLTAYSLTAAQEVVRGIGSLEVPSEVKEIYSIFAEFFPEVNEGAPENNGERPPEGVTAKQVKLDVLRELHPDRAVQGEQGTDDEELFKRMVEAQDEGNHEIVQGLYAEVVAKRAMDQAENDSLHELELKRYKAWIALQAVQGRFSDEASVDDWKAEQMQEAPLKTRQMATGQLFGLFFKLMGADQDGKLEFFGPFSNQLSRRVGVMQRRVKAVLKKETADSAALSTAIGEFDDVLPGIVPSLNHLANSYRNMQYTPAGLEALDFCSRVISLCDALDPQPQPIQPEPVWLQPSTYLHGLKNEKSFYDEQSFTSDNRYYK